MAQAGGPPLREAGIRPAEEAEAGRLVRQIDLLALGEAVSSIMFAIACEFMPRA
jgi:hypothetical protein